MIASQACLLVCFLGGLLPYAYANILCSEPLFCQQQWGPDSHCKFSAAVQSGSQGNCSCNSNYYLQDGDSPYCNQCPGVGESCEQSQCCAKGLVCREGICFCVYINEYCWTVNDSERARFQRVAQCILAVALILTTSILFFLFWKACTRREVANQNRGRGSFPSLNSIQHLVLMQLQDRPPPYSTEYLHSWKDPADLYDTPPSYIEALGLPRQDHHVFTLAEYTGLVREGSSAAAAESTDQNQNSSSKCDGREGNGTESDASSQSTSLNIRVPSSLEIPEPAISPTDSTTSDFVNTQNNVNRHVTLHI